MTSKAVFEERLIYRISRCGSATRDDKFTHVTENDWKMAPTKINWCINNKSHRLLFVLHGHCFCWPQAMNSYVHDEIWTGFYPDSDLLVHKMYLYRKITNLVIGHFQYFYIPRFTSVTTWKYGVLNVLFLK